MKKMDSARAGQVKEKRKRGKKREWREKPVSTFCTRGSSNFFRGLSSSFFSFLFFFAQYGHRHASNQIGSPNITLDWPNQNLMKISDCTELTLYCEEQEEVP